MTNPKQDVRIAEDLQQSYWITLDSLEHIETENNENSRRTLDQIKYYIERISHAEAEVQRLREELEAKGGAIFKLYVWRGRPDWVVMCHARTVAEARELASDDSMGDGDWSTPVRLRMMKAVRKANPEIHYRECGETVLTATGEVEELELYAKTKDAEIQMLQTENTALRKQVETYEKPVSDEEWYLFRRPKYANLRGLIDRTIAARKEAAK